MTKLLQWLCFLGLVFTIWVSLLTDILPFKISKNVRDVALPFPFYMVIVFGCYSLAVIGYRVLTFNDCEDAADSLRKEIQEARQDLTRKGKGQFTQAIFDVIFLVLNNVIELITGEYTWSNNFVDTLASQPTGSHTLKGEKSQQKSPV